MAVNYGLGTENAGGVTFGTAYSNSPQDISIAAVDQFASLTDLTLAVIGSGEGSAFDYTHHNINVSSSKIIVGTTGQYLISYSATSSNASGDNLSFQIWKNGSTDMKITTQVYSRGGNMYESGASGIVFLEESSTLELMVANTSDDSNITLDNVNISLVKIIKGGQFDS